MIIREKCKLMLRMLKEDCKAESAEEKTLLRELLEKHAGQDESHESEED